ncbi:hypothetical protein TNIN_178641 [Trichonephila inaurata madagascariensis]|uniref:Uncharacterized protein n=1 Tax=Trichonephila inaurata madagascariensis TaxID=2747483 RepID=A0A8X6XYJ4_9ARAC|nr:hypothetical protein TNIN_178641 [Trichonephila inaurata madagascariensis]
MNFACASELALAVGEEFVSRETKRQGSDLSSPTFAPGSSSIFSLYSLCNSLSDGPEKQSSHVFYRKEDYSACVVKTRRLYKLLSLSVSLRAEVRKHRISLALLQINYSLRNGQGRCLLKFRRKKGRCKAKGFPTGTRGDGLEFSCTYPREIWKY